MDGQARIEAAVVEIGVFRKLTGTVASVFDPGSRQFDFLPDPGQGVADVPHSVVLQTGAGLYSADGKALQESALAEGTRVEVDGVLIRVDIGPNIINAAFVSVETAVPEEQAVSGAASCDSSRTDVLLITSDGDTASTEYVGLGEVWAGDEAEIYGAYDAQSGCLLVVQRGR
jgi:hypothetical protein